MAYLGNGIYDLLDVIKASKDPSIAYEGLYQDPRRDDTIYSDGYLKPAYGLNDNVKSLQAFYSSAFPQGIDAFRPRIGTPKPDFINAPQNDYASLYNNQPDFINAPQNDYASLYSLPELDTSRFKGTNLESGYLDRAGSYGQDVYSEKPRNGGIGGLFRFLLGLAAPGFGTVFNLATGGFDRLRGGFDKGLGALRNINQRIQNTDFGQSRTLQEYMMKRRERKQAERAQEAMPEVYRSAREQGFTNDRGGFSTNRADRAGTSIGSGQFSPSTSRGRSGY